MSSLCIFPDPDALADAIALRFRKESKQAARENRLYSIVLSGGNTADKVYRRFGLSKFGNEIPWESVHVFWTDERCVSPESKKFPVAYIPGEWYLDQAAASNLKNS